MPKYLQGYEDEHALRYTHREDIEPMYWVLLSKQVLVYLVELP